MEITLTDPESPHQAVLGSITSTNVQKITFTWAPCWDSPPANTYWRAYDLPLCLLADRLGWERELEAEFKLMDEVEAMAIVDSLPEFRKKGRITVFRAWADGGERRIYPLPSGV